MIIKLPWLLRKPDYSHSRNFVRVIRVMLFFLTGIVAIPFVLILSIIQALRWCFEYAQEEDESPVMQIRYPDILWDNTCYLFVFWEQVRYDKEAEVWISVPKNLD